jgi:2-haloacid dehalogenase
MRFGFRHRRRSVRQGADGGNPAIQPAAIVFDLFGTLLDIASLHTAAAQYTSDAAAFVASWREKQLGYAFAATIMERYEDFDILTERALHYAAARHGLSDDTRRWETPAAQWRRTRPFPDAQPALVKLRERGLPCAVLTNGTPETAAAALESAGLSGAVDVVLSVDSVATDKPSARVYALATAHYATAPARLVEFGLRVIWCNRGGAPAETFGAPAASTIGSLRELSGAIANLG